MASPMLGKTRTSARGNRFRITGTVVVPSTTPMSRPSTSEIRLACSRYAITRVPSRKNGREEVHQPLPFPGRRRQPADDVEFAGGHALESVGRRHREQFERHVAAQRAFRAAPDFLDQIDREAREAAVGREVREGAAVGPGAGAHDAVGGDSLEDAGARRVRAGEREAQERQGGKGSGRAISRRDGPRPESLKVRSSV